MFGLRSATDPSPCPTPSPCGSDRPPLGWSSNNSGSSSTATLTTVGPPVAEKPRWHHGRRTPGHFLPLDITGTICKLWLSRRWIAAWIHVCWLIRIIELKVKIIHISLKTPFLWVNSPLLLFLVHLENVQQSCIASSLKVVEKHCEINLRMLLCGPKCKLKIWKWACCETFIEGNLGGREEMFTVVCKTNIKYTQGDMNLPLFALYYKYYHKTLSCKFSPLRLLERWGCNISGNSWMIHSQAHPEF